MLRGPKKHSSRDLLYCVDEGPELESTILDRDFSGQSDVQRRSFEEIVPLKSRQLAELPDVFTQSIEAGVQTEVWKRS